MIFYSTSTISSRYLAFDDKNEKGLSPELKTGPTFFKSIECFHSRDHHLCKFIGTKESVCIRKEFNSHRTGLGHQHGRRFIVLGHQYGRRDVMWKHSINFTIVEKSASKAMWSRFVSLWEITRYLSLKGRGTKQSSAGSVLTQNEHFKKNFRKQ